MNKEYEKLLTRLGLDDKESQIYLVVLTLQTATATEISKKSAISRTTCYGILEALVARGLVSKTDQSGVLKFNADNPELLATFVDNQKTELDILGQEIKKIIPDLKALRKEHSLKPGIEFFEGKNAVAAALQSDWSDVKRMAKEDETLYIHGNTEGIIKAWPGFLKYAKKRVATGLKIKMLISDEVEDERMKTVHKQHFQIKQLPEKYSYRSGSHISSRKIILFDFDNSVVVILENESLAQMMRNFFDFMWEYV